MHLPLQNALKEQVAAACCPAGRKLHARVTGRQSPAEAAHQCKQIFMAAGPESGR